MLILQISFVAIMTALAYTIMIQPSELLQRWSRLWNTKFSDTIIQKLFTCGYCVSGQIALWCSVFLSKEIETFITVPISIFFTWLIIKELKRINFL